MSVHTAKNSAPTLESSRTGLALHRSRRRGTRPGISLLAQGEPMVWLTGGALAISLLMISGLLLLVVVAGMRTFWPQPLALFPLRNGTQYLGEVTRSEEFILAKDTLGSLDKPLAEAALTLLAGNEQAASKRRLVRTGNFEITNAHFHWVSDFEITGRGVQQPPWAVIAERVEWGRFYGQPVEFVLTHRRRVPAEEEQLLQILQFFQSSVYQLSDEDQQKMAASMADIQELLTPLRDQYAAVRRRNIEDFLGRIPKSPDSQLRAVLDTGAVIAVADLKPEDNTQAIHQVWSGPEQAWAKYEEYHEGVRDRVARQRHLEKHDIGRANRDLEQARLAIRQQELNVNVFVLSTASEIKAFNLELRGLDRTKEETDVLLHALTRRLAQIHP